MTTRNVSSDGSRKMTSSFATVSVTWAFVLGVVSKIAIKNKRPHRIMFVMVVSLMMWGIAGLRQIEHLCVLLRRRSPDQVRGKLCDVLKYASVAPLCTP